MTPRKLKVSMAELEAQHTAQLPDRELLLTVSLLGIPLLTLDGLDVNVDTAGPNWLAGSIGGG